MTTPDSAAPKRVSDERLAILAFSFAANWPPLYVEIKSMIAELQERRARDKKETGR